MIGAALVLAGVATVFGPQTADALTTRSCMDEAIAFAGFLVVLLVLGTVAATVAIYCWVVRATLLIARCPEEEL